MNFYIFFLYCLLGCNILSHTSQNQLHRHLTRESILKEFQSQKDQLLQKALYILEEKYIKIVNNSLYCMSLSVVQKKMYEVVQ